jgi:hypothetical protein
MKHTTFIQTEALANQPKRCRDRIMPNNIPTTMKITMQAIKQMLSLANWAMVWPQARIRTETVMNCCNDWVMLMKWRDFLPYTRKKVSP